MRRQSLWKRALGLELILLISPSLVSAEPSQSEDEIVMALKAARWEGDIGAATALQTRLDQRHGIGRNEVPNVTSDCRVDIPGPEAPPPGVEWPFPDVLVTDPTRYEIKPSMTTAPNGDIFVAAEDAGSLYIRLYRSTDSGQSWSYFFGFGTLDDSRNPAITFVEIEGVGKWLIAAYEVWHTNQSRSVMAFRLNLDTFAYDFVALVSGVFMAGPEDQIHPQIATDVVLYPSVPYVYVTYALYSIDYYAVFHTRSFDRGLNWSSPVDVTGPAESTGWATRPDIAFGSSGLFISFAKPGWTGQTFAIQVWVTQSTNYGSSWTTPLQITSLENPEYHPSVAAAYGLDSVVVAYTNDFTADLDVNCTYSTDGGATWSAPMALPWSYDNEESVDLAVSPWYGGFHAAYWHEYDIWYTSSDTGLPGSWSNPAETVNAANYASSLYSRPTIAVIPNRAVAIEPAVAWTDFRNPLYGACFNSPSLIYIFLDGFESEDTSAWSLSLP